MSRIHEALKKAEQERVANTAVGTDILTASPMVSAPSHPPEVVVSSTSLLDNPCRIDPLLRRLDF